MVASAGAPTYIAGMQRWIVILGAIIFVGALAALIVPLWVGTAGIGLSPAGYGAVALMVVFCFAVGGGLMFLIFYSARKGYDDAAHQARRDGGDLPP
jgi:hypothetical protein